MAYTPPAYLEPTDPGAFDDWMKREPWLMYTKECPRCKGHGGWNLTLNAYKLHPGVADTPSNRHLYSHFRTVCGHCNGHGYIHPENTCPGHEWVFKENLGRCYNRYRCIHCTAVSDWDSGD